MKTVIHGILVLFIFSSEFVEAQVTKIPRKPSLNLFLRWSQWELDSGRNDLGQKEIYWEHYKYRLDKNMKSESEKFIFTFNECNQLIRKIKMRKLEGCFGGPEKVIFDKKYKRSCK